MSDSKSKILNSQQKLDLANLIKANDTIDCTEEIREKKQSIHIRNDVKQMVMLKQKYARLAKSNPSEFDKMCVNQCQFLFNNYTDLYNKLKNDNLNLGILEKFLDILQEQIGVTIALLQHQIDNIGLVVTKTRKRVKILPPPKEKEFKIDTSVLEFEAEALELELELLSF